MKTFYPLLVTFLREAGYFQKKKRGKGSHEVWGSDGSPSLIVPKNLYSRDTANAILKRAGINKKL